MVRFFIDGAQLLLSDANLGKDETERAVHRVQKHPNQKLVRLEPSIEYCKSKSEHIRRVIKNIIAKKYYYI